MTEPFWQRPFDAISYADVVAFLDEEVPEGISLEYKGATAKQNGLPDFEKENVLDTLVAFANTTGGMMLYGVNEEEGTKRPIITIGFNATTEKARRLLDLGTPLVDACARRINPRIPLEWKQIRVEDGSGEDRRLLLIRVLAGARPPYALDSRYIKVRTGEKDELATLTEIEAMIERRANEGVAENLPAEMIARNLFDYTALSPDDHPQCLTLSVTPAFPVPTIPASLDTDRKFQELCRQVFGEGEAVQRNARGIIYMPAIDPHRRDNPACAMAFDNGSIGVRRPLGVSRAVQIDLVWLWQKMRELIFQAIRWPRNVFSYNGSMIFRFAISNIDGVVVSNEATSGWSEEVPEAFRNHLRAWTYTREWNPAMTLDDLVDPAMASFSRQLQYPYFEAIRDAIPDRAMSP